MPQKLLTRHPIDDTTYDLLVVISSKLEAMHVYERFGGAGIQDRALSERLRNDDARHIDLLVDALRERLGTDRTDAGPPAGEPPAAEAVGRADARAGGASAFDWVADRQ